jgi:RNA polymerase sigma factor (sigma-70 family)
MNDWQLLRDYVERGAEDSFRTLVDRHLRLVHGAAVRQTRDAQLAEEITQAVFILLARKARSFRRDVILPGWLFRTTRFVATRAVRSEHRRQRREQEALAVPQPLQTTETVAPRLLRLLDEALGGLPAKDRDAVLLRFMQDQSHREVGAALGLGEETAKKRVQRALERLRRFFAHRGINVPVAVLAAVLTEAAAQAAPAGLAAQVATQSLAGGAAGGALLPELVRETLSAWRWAKLKIIGSCAAIGLGLAAGVGLLPAPRAAAGAPTAATETYDFLVRGDLIRTTPPDQNEGRKETNRFEFHVNGQVWWARTESLGRWAPFESCVAGSDGTNYYQIDTGRRSMPGFDPANLPPQIRAATPPQMLQRMISGYTNEHPSHSAFIYPGYAPIYSLDQIAPLWLAFGSGHYFAMPHTEQTAPWILYGFDVRREYPAILAADVSLKKGRWPLAERIVYGPQISAGRLDELDRFKLAGAASELCTGDYVVSASTNLGGLWLPLKFTLRRFLGRIPRPEGQRILMEQFAGTVREIVTNAGPITLPIPEKGFSVSDHRVPSVGQWSSFEYLGDGPRWKSLNEVMSSDAYLRRTGGLIRQVQPKD